MVIPRKRKASRNRLRPFAKRTKPAASLRNARTAEDVAAAAHCKLGAAREYLRLRGKGWRAADALRAGKILQEFAELESYDESPTDYHAAVRFLAQEMDANSVDYANATYDCNPETEARNLDRVASEPLTVISAEYWDGSAWHSVGSTGGFIGEDWRDSGYDTELMAEAVAAAQRVLDAIPEVV